MLCTSSCPSVRPSVRSHARRIVQLGFLTTAARFLLQAESLRDEKAEELLSHGLWCLSLNLTEIRCPTTPPPAIDPLVGRQGSSRTLQDHDGKSSVQGGKLNASSRAGSKRFPRIGDPQETPGSHHPCSKGTRAGQEETPQLTQSATSLRNRTLPSRGSAATVLWGADRPTTGYAALSKDVDGSGGAGYVCGRSRAGALGEEGGFGVAEEGGTRKADERLSGSC